MLALALLPAGAPHKTLDRLAKLEQQIASLESVHALTGTVAMGNSCTASSDCDNTAIKSMACYPTREETVCKLQTIVPPGIDPFYECPVQPMPLIAGGQCWPSAAFANLFITKTSPRPLTGADCNRVGTPRPMRSCGRGSAAAALDGVSLTRATAPADCCYTGVRPAPRV